MNMVSPCSLSIILNIKMTRSDGTGVLCVCARTNTDKMDGQKEVRSMKSMKSMKNNDNPQMTNNGKYTHSREGERKKEEEKEL